MATGFWLGGGTYHHAAFAEDTSNRFKREEAPAKGMCAMELFALGTAICDVTEWAVPYGSIAIEELQMCTQLPTANVASIRSISSPLQGDEATRRHATRRSSLSGE